MAYQYKNNLTPATGSEAIYNIKAAVKQAGWTVTSSSDGTTYNALGDQISSPGAGANGMANNGAWFVVRDPASIRQLCIQRSTAGSNQNWRFKYSKGAGFIGGVPGSTRVPSATDEQVILGGGTDAAPTFSQWFAGADGSYRFSAAADDASPYNVYSFAFPTGGGTTYANHAFFIDAMDPILSAPFNASDNDPVVIGASASGNDWGIANINFSGWLKGVWQTNIRVITPQSYNGNFPITLDPSTGKAVGLVPTYIYNGGIYIKGYGTLWEWLLSGNGGAPFNMPTPFTKTLNNDKVSAGNVVLPWDGSSPVV